MTHADIITELTPYTLTVDDESWARAAFSWALNLDATHMARCLKELSPTARREVLLHVDILYGTLRALVQEDGGTFRLTAEAEYERGYLAGRAEEREMDIRDAVRANLAAVFMTPDALPDFVDGHPIGTRSHA